MMYSQARYQQEHYYDDQGGYRQPRGGYNAQLSNPYGYEDDEDYRATYQPRRPPPRTHDEYDDPPRWQSPRAQYDDREYGDYDYSRKTLQPPQRKSFYDDPPESYQESSYDHDYEHSRRAQPLRRDTSYDHSREYQTPRYYRDGYGEEYHDQEDYDYEHRRDRRSSSYQSYKSQSYPSNHYDDDDDYLPQRGSTNSQSYDSYPPQAYSPQSYTQNTPPPKKKSIAEQMYEHWLNPKPKDPNDPYKTIEEHLCEDMKLQVTCHACKGPHYRYQCRKYPYCEICKAKFSCECRGKHRWEDESDQRLGINIVPDVSMEDDFRVTPRVDQCVNNYGKQINFEVPLEEVIEGVKESEQEIPVSEELQDQEKGNPDGGNESEFEGEKNKEELPFGETLEAHCGKILHSTCANTTIGKNFAKSWADMCEEDDCDDIGVPMCVNNCNIDNVDNGVEEIVAITRDINCTIENVENAFVEPSCDDESLALVDNALTSNHDGDMHEIFYFDDENNVDDSLFEANKVEFSDFFDTYLDDALFVHDMIGEIVNDEENVKLDTLEEEECEKEGVEEDNVNVGSIVEIEDVMEKNITLEETSCKINIEEKGREDEDVEENESVEGQEKIEKKEKENEKQEIMVEEVEKEEGKENLEKKEELKEGRKAKEKKKVEENSTLLDVDSCQLLEESVLYVDLKEFVNARHLRAYLEERVDGEKRLVSVQVCLNDGSKVASG